MQNKTTLSIYVDGKKISAAKDDNLLDILNKNDFKIPTLCYHKGVPSYGACRLCSVEIKEKEKTKIITSCTYPIRTDGLEVFTNSSEVLEIREMIIKLLLAKTPSSEKIKELAKTYGVESEDRFVTDEDKDKKRNKENLCILCGLCVRTCNDVLNKGAISFVNRGIDRKVAPPFEEPPKECIGCEACSVVCPTGQAKTKIQDSRKYIDPWGAEFDVIKCGNCENLYFFTDQTINEVNYKTKSESELNLGSVNEDSEYARYCPKCKRKLNIKNFKDSKTLI
ncbi:2Fe-2S iron-sulfur cluster-binding protein [Natranaerofaba carboxydovora]|uniref:2Fe-2S iron-sulfur cluster-binding protein n=1 Tax=Natranaerofaba carboxydovora TaxID=2742683 RepID=UPI001F146FA7|nr:2Fe-2S iron-sulfur cluster-binding protein [Natranaerofaba carboxydovora]UMZ73586.1 NADPH-Fe(3+) oxidoreductase subunit alpha [Natranaerofaba carboxydovora]